MLIFDMDGTLIDSNGVWKEVDIAFLAKRGLPYTQEYYEGVSHTIFPLAAVFTKEYAHLKESCEEIMAEWMEMAGNTYGEKVPIKPGVRAFLERCRQAGERMVVFTAAVPEHCHAALDHLELSGYFEQIIFAQELQMEKKDPRIFHKVCEMLSVKEKDCTLFDDSVAACRSAKAAGLQVVGVYDAYFSHTEKEMRRVCDRYIMGFEELL